MTMINDYVHDYDDDHDHDYDNDHDYDHDHDHDQVPYGIMVPPSIDNLLVAGRYFSHFESDIVLFTFQFFSCFNFSSQILNDKGRHHYHSQVCGRRQDIPLCNEKHDGLHGHW